MFHDSEASLNLSNPVSRARRFGIVSMILASGAGHVARQRRASSFGFILVMRRRNCGGVKPPPNKTSSAMHVPSIKLRAGASRTIV
jgi:hypothetical protein